MDGGRDSSPEAGRPGGVPLQNQAGLSSHADLLANNRRGGHELGTYPIGPLSEGGGLGQVHSLRTCGAAV